MKPTRPMDRGGLGNGADKIDGQRRAWLFLPRNKKRSDVTYRTDNRQCYDTS